MTAQPMIRAPARGLLAAGTTSPAEAIERLRQLVDRTPVLRVVAPGTVARMQLPERFDLAVLGPGFFDAVATHEHRLAVHNVVAHLEPSAYVLALLPLGNGEYLGLARASGLEIVAEPISPTAGAVVVHRRTRRRTIHDMIAEARDGLRRVDASELARLLADGECVVLDTRTPTDRQRFGVLPNSIHAPRCNLEWMCDPASGYSHELITDFDQMLVVVCNEGYSSSLAAASLQRLGYGNATDLIGGVIAWRAAGLPLERPDHTRFN